MEKIKSTIAKESMVCTTPASTFVHPFHLTAMSHFSIFIPLISDHQQSWGEEDGPWKRPGPPLLVAADCLKEFFDLCIIRSAGFGDQLTDLLLATTLYASAIFGGGCSACIYQQIEKKNMKKFFFNSIHKPPASITFAPIKHALAVTVEPFKFSSRQGGAAYELS